MTDPRLITRYDLIRNSAVTFAHDGTIVADKTQEGGSAQVGKAVALDSDSTVRLAGAGDLIFGKLALVDDDGFCTVQEDGYATMDGTGGTFTVGEGVVGVAGGLINGSATGKHTVVDASDLTAVVVRLS